MRLIRLSNSRVMEFFTSIRMAAHMIKLVAFGAATLAIVFISRRSLRVPWSHGFYRFFAWECIVALFFLNVNFWFWKPFIWHQLISWFLLISSLIPLIYGIRSLRKKGNPVQDRKGEPQLLSFEKTSTLVTTGIYRYIRHPLYSSLLLLTWGIFFKTSDWLGLGLALIATAFLVATAKADEKECIRFFGSDYAVYMQHTKRFIPFLF
jgi:protein-S-isoprenylcysteine O-methyltransferase Ste14